MIILGISSHYHDASAAIIVDGKVIASASEERFSREKHDPSFPHDSIVFCLNQAGIKKEQIDYVAYHEDPLTKFTRNLSSSLIRWPVSFSTFVNSMKEAVTSGLWIRNQISKELDIHPRRIICIPHHLGHAAHSFLTSPFLKSTVITLDAVGEWTSTAIFAADCEKSPMLNAIAAVPFPHSIGLVYSAFTGFLGFKVNSSENSTMALASFGTPKYADIMRKIISILPDQLYEIDLSYFDFSQTNNLPLTEKFYTTFGKARSFKTKLSFDCLEDSQKAITADEQRFADIAASLQIVTEETIIHIANQAYKRNPSDNLCLSGGVALNCVANGKLLSSTPFKLIYCPPDPGDGGGAMGAALYLSMTKKDITRPIEITPFLGEAHNSKDIYEMLTFVNSSSWHKFSKIPLDPKTHSQFIFTQLSNQDETIDKVASLISENKIVGWFQGRFENGPRALGARSILINPANIALARRMSSTVKLRASYRPYACSFTEDSAKKYLHLPKDELPLLSKWMLCTLKVKNEFVPLLRAAINIDHTTRPQVVTKDENEIYYKLIKKIGEKTGTEAVLNTSFNESGHPLINTPIEALLMFARTSLDVLVIENLLIERKV